MIPFFLNHYNWVDEIFIFDDGSEDDSKKLLENLNNVTLTDTSDFRNTGSNIVDFNKFYNQVWKRSKKIADWVILCNLDEHFYYQGNIKNYLQNCTTKGITYIPSTGYDMIGKFPTNKKEILYKHITKGKRRHAFDKTFAFNPDQISESIFFGGRHQCLPQGNIVYPKKYEILLLHFKYTGFFNFLKKETKKKTRISVYKSNRLTKSIIYLGKLFISKKVIQ